MSDCKTWTLLFGPRSAFPKIGAKSHEMLQCKIGPRRFAARPGPGVLSRRGPGSALSPSCLAQVAVGDDERASIGLLACPGSTAVPKAMATEAIAPRAARRSRRERECARPRRAAGRRALPTHAGEARNRRLRADHTGEYPGEPGRSVGRSRICAVRLPRTRPVRRARRPRRRSARSPDRPLPRGAPSAPPGVPNPACGSIDSVVPGSRLTQGIEDPPGVGNHSIE